VSYGKLLTSTVTYWAPGGLNAYGEPAHAAPVQIKARWEEHNERFDDLAGKSFVSAAIVYSKDEVVQDGWLCEGVSMVADPKLVSAAHRVRRIYRTSTPDGSITVRKAVLG